MVVNTLTVRGRDQVMLKVTIAEIDRNIAKQLGITTSSLTANWGIFTQSNPFAINGALGALPVFTGTNPLASAAQNGTSTALTATNPSNTLSATLQAFERYGVSRILAEPTVTAVSGENAKLTVGGEIPIPGPSTCMSGGCTGGGAIFQPYGVTLRFSPVVLSEGRILLHLATEVTEIDTQTEATVYGTVVPGLLTRKNETSVVSMTETNCAKWRRESVPVGLREKGCEAPIYFRASMPIYILVARSPSFGIFGFWLRS